jgi:hypothetical protein
MMLLCHVVTLLLLLLQMTDRTSVPNIWIAGKLSLRQQCLLVACSS